VDRIQTPAERAAQGAVVIQHPASAETPTNSTLPPIVDWENLEERGAPPSRDWAMDYWIGMGHVTGLWGRGAIGKSFAAQQIGTALALGRDFVGRIKQPRVVLMWAAEDDHDELWRRQLPICKRFGVPLSALRGMLNIEPMAAVDCSLLESVQGEVVFTSMLQALSDQIAEFKAEVVILDNIARLYGGNENDRHQVTRFIGGLNRGAAATGAAVLLLGHPAKPKESEYSGSAAWENSCRGRLWLTDKPPDQQHNIGQEDEDEPPTNDKRYLCKRKVNYTSNDVAILSWVPEGESGSYEIIQAPSHSGLIKRIDSDHAKRVVMNSFPRFKQMGIDPVESTSSQNYLPKLIRAHGLTEGFSQYDLTRAMRACMLEGTLKKAQIGVYANRTPRFGLIAIDRPTEPPTPRPDAA